MKPKTTRRKIFNLKPRITERQRRKLFRDIVAALKEALRPVKRA